MFPNLDAVELLSETEQKSHYGMNRTNSPGCKEW